MRTKLIESVSPTLLVIVQATLSLSTLKRPTEKLEVVQLYAVAVSETGELVPDVPPMLAANVLFTRVEEPVSDGWVYV